MNDRTAPAPAVHFRLCQALLICLGWEDAKYHHLPIRALRRIQHCQLYCDKVIPVLDKYHAMKTYEGLKYKLTQF
jgi:hypothetical protein